MPTEDVAESWLFESFGSGAPLLTDAVFSAVPSSIGVTLILTSSELKLPRLPRSQNAAPTRQRASPIIIGEAREAYAPRQGVFDHRVRSRGRPGVAHGDSVIERLSHECRTGRALLHREVGLVGVTSWSGR